MHKSNVLKSQFLFALLFPFWSMIASIRFFKSPSARNLFWYGCAFMGFVFIFNPVFDTGADSTRIARALIEMHSPDTTIKDVFSDLFVEDGNVDVYQLLVTFIVSIFTSNAHYLFLTMAIIFGFFYSRNVWRILNVLKLSTNQTYVWIFIAMLFLVNPIWNINGGRMYVALHVFIYGIFGYFFEKKPTYLIWSFISIFIHFSLVLPLSLFIVLQFLPQKNIQTYFFLYFISLFVNDIDMEGLKTMIIDYLPKFLIYKADAYLNEELAISISEGVKEWSTYLFFSKYMNMVFKYIVLFVFWKNIKKVEVNIIFRNLMITFLFLGFFINILSSIPSMGRFISLSDFFMYSLLLLIISNVNLPKLSTNLLKYSSILLILPIFHLLRIGTIYYGHSLFWSNFVGALFIEDRNPIIQYVKSIF
ncbi:MAG: hypothetical protein ACOYMD_00985 [Paludibacter sp.]